MSSASRAPDTPPTLRPALAARPSSLLAAIVSDRPDAIADAARATGIAADCANAATLWLLPYNAPRILFLDLPVTGTTSRRLGLLVRQLCRAYPELVIAALGPTDGLPIDIEVEDSSDTSLTEAFAEARHLLRPVPGPRSLFYPLAHPRRATLFR